MNDDTQLLRQYTREGSEPAFRELVERHISLVYATARRMVAGDVHLAQDVTQTVFTDLARKAAALPEGVLLGGWLHRHTCFTAANAIRAEHRRRTRERIAMEMHDLNENSAHNAQWAQLAPVLDEALNSLDSSDRDAIVLRYFQNNDLRAIGLALGTSDDTAQKRIARALDKLRVFLTRRGVTLSAVMLGTALDASAMTPVPAGLSTSISSSALGAVGPISSLPLLAKLPTMITTKLAYGLAAAVAAAGIAAALVIQSQSSAPAPAAKPASVVAPPRVAGAPRAPVPPAVPLPTIAVAPKPRPASQNVAPVSSVDDNAPTTDLVPAPGVHSVSVVNGVMTITTNENGVITTQTAPVPANGMVTNPDNPNVVLGVLMAGTPPPNGGTQFGTGSGSRTLMKASNGTLTVTTTDENGQTSTQVLPAGDYQSTLTITGSATAVGGGGGGGAVINGNGMVINVDTGNP